MEWAPGWEVLGRLVVATVLGALVGLEREITEHDAGLRTHATVALGAALFGVVSTLGFDEFAAPRNETNFQVDVTRVASQVVVGIGFLGAGLIFRRGESVRNLTTAASLWVTAAIGLTAGVGDAGSAAVAAVVLAFLLVALPKPTRWAAHRFGQDRRSVRALVVPGVEPAALVAQAEACRLDVTRTVVEKHEGRLTIHLQLAGPRDHRTDDRLADLARSELVTDLRIDG